MHQLAAWSVVDGLGGGNQRDAALPQIGHDERVIDPVPGQPAQLVDDHMIDVAGVADASKHPLESARLDISNADRPGSTNSSTILKPSCSALRWQASRCAGIEMPFGSEARQTCPADDTRR